MPDKKAVVAHEYFEEQAMSVEKLTHQMSIVKGVLANVMVDGEHYGSIPGCGPKKVLHKPGAEKLCVTFRLAPSYEIKKTVLRDDHREYEIICTLTHIGSGDIIGQGLGSCSTLESKYRYRNAPLVCPKCEAEDTIIKGKEEYGGGWLCYGKKGGCGAKFKDGDPEIENQDRGRVEYADPADYYNTVLKMAKKRSMTDAVLTATAASDIFTTGDGDDGLGSRNDPGGSEPPTLEAYEALVKIGKSRKDPLSRQEINKIANWYRKGDRLTKAELDEIIKDFETVFNEYLDQISKGK